MEAGCVSLCRRIEKVLWWHGLFTGVFLEQEIDCCTPQVGIGVVMLRKCAGRQDATPAAEVLLVRRAKAPAVGMWTVPGGSLELGEEQMSSLIGWWPSIMSGT